MSRKFPPEESSCHIKELPKSDIIKAANLATTINPNNAPIVPEQMGTLSRAIAESLDLSKSDEDWITEELAPNPTFLAVLTTKYWGSKGVRLTVSFMDSIPNSVREKILKYANKWGEYGNIKFEYTTSDGQVRITTSQSGYWSYLGTDVLRIARNQPTMCLQGFNSKTSDAEYDRVVVHEFGHTLGFPHGQLMPEVVNRIDRDKAIALFKRTNGWSASTTIANVLTPIDLSEVIAGPQGTHEDSVMTYMLPASITKDGRPVQGSPTITRYDADFVRKIYPKEITSPPPEKGETRVTLLITGQVDSVKIVEG